MINVDHNPVETEDGVWTDPFKGVEFLVTHVSSMDFQKKLARLQQPHAKKIEQGKLSPVVQRDILCTAMAGTIVKNWRGNIVDKDNQPVKFTEGLAKQVLMNQIDVREFVTMWAADLDHYRQEEATELGNS